MRVEVTEDILRDKGYNQVKGDIITVPDEIGQAWCAHGWAKDTEGVVPTGERVVQGVIVRPHDTVMGMTTKEA